MYKLEWQKYLFYNTVYDSIHNGAVQADENDNFLSFKTKKQARLYSIKNYGEEYTKQCVFTVKGYKL